MSDVGVDRSIRERDRASELKRLDRLAHIMDSLLRIPGTRRSVGADAALSLVPVLGSVVGAGVSAYLVYEAVRMQAPRAVILKMSRNVAVDWLLGEVPLLGPVFDLFYKANEANMKLLRAHIEADAAGAAREINPRS